MGRIKITDARWFITIGFIGLYLNLNDLISVLYFVLVQREKNKGSFSLSLVISNKLVSKTLSAKHTYFWWKKNDFKDQYNSTIHIEVVQYNRIFSQYKQKFIYYKWKNPNIAICDVPLKTPLTLNRLSVNLIYLTR